MTKNKIFELLVGGAITLGLVLGVIITLLVIKLTTYALLYGV